MSGRDDDRNGGEGGDHAAELSMSIEETNKLRASLGLAPLKETSDKDAAAKDEHKKRKRAEEDAASTAELEERVRVARERRRQQELLTNTKSLAESEPEVDDVMAWVDKSRKIAEKAPKTQQGKKRSNVKSKTSRNEDGGGGGDLAGMKVKFGAADLEAGDEMILTLEDRGILDDKGQLNDEDDEEAAVVLENVQQREDKQRAKAFRESKKTGKPLWEEDGQQRSLLDKYDEEEEQAFQLDDAGAIEADKLKRQNDIRAKLDAAKMNNNNNNNNGGAENSNTGPSSDYYTPEEMEAMRKPKKKKERKLKKKALTADELTALEEAAAAATGGGGGDLGSRADRERRAAERTTAAATEDQERRSRFDAALSKANYASLALKSDDAAKKGNTTVNEEEDEDLYRSLKKARELAAKKSGVVSDATAVDASGASESIAQQLLKRRENGKTNNGGGGGAAAVGGSLIFTDISEFTRGISVKEEEFGGKGKGVLLDALPVKMAETTTGVKEGKGEDDVKLDVEMTMTMAAPPHAPPAPESDIKEEDDDDDIPVPMEEDNDEAAPPPPAGGGDGGWGSWGPSSDDKEDVIATLPKHDGVTTGNAAAVAAPSGGAPARKNYRRRPPSETDHPSSSSNAKIKEEAGMAAEKSIGSGLGSALAFLKERGELTQPVEWSGRTNDSRDAYFTKAMGGYKDVYTGGREEERIARDVEVALTKRDEFGRVLTPKEAFRQLCHDFHGIKPSKNTIEKRQKQVAKEMAQRKAATGAVGGTVAGLQALQKANATPYMVLSGTVKPGQSRDAANGYSSVDREEMEQQQQQQPRLSDGGQTPLLGRAKVEAMLGMQPPPPRPPSGKK